jgi:hypothetical protein
MTQSDKSQQPAKPLEKRKQGSTPGRVTDSAPDEPPKKPAKEAPRPVNEKFKKIDE